MTIPKNTYVNYTKLLTKKEYIKSYIHFCVKRWLIRKVIIRNFQNSKIKNAFSVDDRKLCLDNAHFIKPYQDPVM